MLHELAARAARAARHHVTTTRTTAPPCTPRRRPRAPDSDPPFTVQCGTVDLSNADSCACTNSSCVIIGLGPPPLPPPPRPPVAGVLGRASARYGATGGADSAHAEPKKSSSCCNTVRAARVIARLSRGCYGAVAASVALNRVNGQGNSGHTCRCVCILPTNLSANLQYHGTYSSTRVRTYVRTRVACIAIACAAHC